MGDRGEPLPRWVEEIILSRMPDRQLAEKALRYIRVVKRDDEHEVIGDIPPATDHALLLAVHTCMSYARRLLRGEDPDDP